MKEEWKSTKSFYYSFLRRKAQHPARIETVCRKKPRLTPRIEPGPLRQKSVALPLALPPLPKAMAIILSYCRNKMGLYQSNLEKVAGSRLQNWFPDMTHSSRLLLKNP